MIKAINRVIERLTEVTLQKAGK